MLLPCSKSIRSNLSLSQKTEAKCFHCLDCSVAKVHIKKYAIQSTYASTRHVTHKNFVSCQERKWKICRLDFNSESDSDAEFETEVHF